MGGKAVRDIHLEEGGEKRRREKLKVHDEMLWLAENFTFVY